MIKISIITINFNNQLGLEKTILSVINQTIKPFEYIVIDGGSTDGSKEIIESYSQSIQFWVSETDHGVYHAMNKGIEKATGDYLLFLNAGDRLYQNETIEKVLSKMEDNVDLYYGDTEYEELSKPNYIKYYPNILDFNYFYNFNISHQSSFIKRTLFHTVGLYNENYKIVSDWEFFITALYLYRASYEHLNCVVSTYDGAGISSNLDNYPLMYNERNQTIDTYFSGFKNDYKLLNRFDDKKMKQLLYIKENNKWQWKFIKLILKINSSLINKKSKT